MAFYVDMHVAFVFDHEVCVLDRFLMIRYILFLCPVSSIAERVEYLAGGICLRDVWLIHAKVKRD